MLDVVAGLDDVDVLGDRAAENHVRQARRDDVVLDRDLVLREGLLARNQLPDRWEELRQPGVEVELAAATPRCRPSSTL